MNVLHTADLHLDRAFEGLRTISSQINDRLQQANQQVLRSIVDCAIINQVDLVIFAGDTFHQSRTSIRTQAYFIEELRRLESESIPVVISFGNHDYYVAQRYWFDFPKNVFLFEKEQVETFSFTTKNQEKVAVSGFSYEHKWIERNLLAEFPVKDPSVDIHIGVYHGEAKTSGINRYAPFSLSEMKTKGYDYWALGHIHQPQIISEQPLAIYPGTPQGHTKKEQNLSGVALVQVEKGQATAHFESLATVLWQTKNYSLEHCQSLQDVLTFLTERFASETHEQTQIQLKELILTNTQHLGEEFTLTYESGEFLRFIQEKTLSQSMGVIYVFQVTLADERSEEKIRLSANPELLKQLETNYLQPDIFSDTTRELTLNALFQGVVTVDDTWRKQSIKAADQQINEDFIIQEDH